MFIAWIRKYICIDVSEDQFLENLGAESTVSSERQDALDFGAGSVTPCSQSAYETDGGAYATYKEYLFLAILATRSILTCSTHIGMSSARQSCVEKELKKLFTNGLILRRAIHSHNPLALPTDCGCELFTCN